MDTWKGKVEVMEGSWGCTWGAPKCTKMATIAWYSKLFWIFPEWLMWSFSILDGHFKGYRSQHKSWWSHGVKHEGHENAPKSTKIHKNSHHSMIEHTVPNLSWVTFNAIFFLIFLKNKWNRVRTIDAFSSVLVLEFVPILVPVLLTVAWLVILSCYIPSCTITLLKIGQIRDFNSCVTDRPTDGRTDRPTDGPTDGHTLL